MTPDITERLARALEPFSEYAVHALRQEQSSKTPIIEFYGFNGKVTKITIGDVRRAKKALAAYRQERPKS